MSDILTREKALEIYYYLRLNRRFEEALARLFRQNKIVGGLYGSLGQEAISVGSAYALGPGDWIAPMIRNIGALLVRGFGPAELFAQFMGRAESPTRGKDNGSHVADLKVRHVVAPTSMLGDLIPVMTGVAMAGRYLGQKIVALTWIGDGGSSTGAFHEGLNFAAAQKAPVVVILENNQWAYSTPVDRQVPLRDLAERARAYGMASAMVDGNVCSAVPSHPPLFSAKVKPCVAAAAPVPASNPLKAPCPVARTQNIPSRNVAKSGALTNPKTSCKKSMMLLKWDAR